MNDDWGHELYDDMIKVQQQKHYDSIYNHPPHYRNPYFEPSKSPSEPLPKPGVEVEKGSADNYKVRLTVEISPELISATKARDRTVMIQVALSEAVKKAARQIIGKIALERLKKSYKDNNSRQDSEQYTTGASQEYPLNSPKKVHKKP